LPGSSSIRPTGTYLLLGSRTSDRSSRWPASPAPNSTAGVAFRASGRIRRSCCRRRRYRAPSMSTSATGPPTSAALSGTGRPGMSRPIVKSARTTANTVAVTARTSSNVPKPYRPR
jgi:hypothetical protein